MCVCVCVCVNVCACVHVYFKNMVYPYASENLSSFFCYITDNQTVV